jgi:hypothetical protein
MSNGSPRDQKTFTELLGELSGEAALLFRQEVALAKAELSEKLSQAGAGAAEVAAGGLIVFLGMQALAAAAVIALAAVLGWWPSALVVGAAVLLVGAAVMIRGLVNLKAERLAPNRTLAALKENRDWAKEHIR